MSTYNQLISEYIKVDNTAIKNIIIDLFVDSDYNSLPNFVEELVKLCGINSMNIMVVHGNRWDVYMSFSENNIFSEKEGMLELVKKPVSKIEAEHILANKVIALLDSVNFQEFKTQITNKTL